MSDHDQVESVITIHRYAQPILDANLMAPGDVQIVLVNERAPLRSRSAVSVTSGDDAASSHEP